jgi:hypothetical protein
MFKDLMHNILGNSGQGVITNAVPGQGQYTTAIGSSHTGPLTTAAYAQQILKKESAPKSRKLFHGTVEVLQVANGYIVNIGRKEGYEYETYIAETITDVNERIAAAIVAFQLES